jgi:hypothetical protein
MSGHTVSIDTNIIHENASSILTLKITKIKPSLQKNPKTAVAFSQTHTQKHTQTHTHKHVKRV